MDFAEIGRRLGNVGVEDLCRNGLYEMMGNDQDRRLRFQNLMAILELIQSRKSRFDLMVHNQKG
jgi:hypothetical protein